MAGATASAALAAIGVNAAASPEAVASLLAELGSGQDAPMEELIERIGAREKARIWRSITIEIERLDGVAESHLRLRGPATPQGATVSGSTRADERELREILRDELSVAYVDRLKGDARRACSQVDSLVNTSLRQLPPQVRATPVREAFKGAKSSSSASVMVGDGEVARKRQDAETQTIANTKRSKPDGSDGGTPCKDSTGTIEELRQREEALLSAKQGLEDFSKILNSAVPRLDALPIDTRRSFVERANDAYDKMFVQIA